MVEIRVAAPRVILPVSILTELFGITTSDVMRTAGSVDLIRIEPRSFDKKAVADPRRFGGFRTLGTATTMGADFAGQLAELLLADESYARGVDKALCAQELVVGARFGAGVDRVELLFLFPCERVVVLRRATRDGQRMPGEYFDPAARAFAALLKTAFPDDEAVRALP